MIHLIDHHPGYTLFGFWALQSVVLVAVARAFDRNSGPGSE